MSRRSRLFQILAGLIVLFAVALSLVPAIVEGVQNKTLRPPPYPVDSRAEHLTHQLTIADMHADSLLWGRDLLRRSSRGHVDVPRLIEGGVALQVFSIVSKSPKGLNIERNSGDTDQITLLAVAELWPPRTWSSLLQRALYGAERLHKFAADSQGKFTVVSSAADLRQYLERRKKDPSITAGMLSIEGAQVLEGDVGNVEKLYAAGFRMMSPAHFFDTEMGGSQAGVQKYGLTVKGREMVRAMEERHMIVDVAHASSQTIADILAMAARPIVSSHTGVKGTCDNNRNLSDEQLKGIARTGGVVGIGYWDTAVCGRDAAAIARAMRYAANLIGVDHVGLGSDFDGAVTEPFDTTGLAQIVEALQKQGFSDEEIGKIMGGNVVKLLLENLPEK